MKKLFLTLLVASFLFAGCVTDFEDFVKNELEIPATKMWVENSTQQVHYVFSVVDATNYHAIRRMLVEMDKRNLHKWRRIDVPHVHVAGSNQRIPD